MYVDQNEDQRHLRYFLKSKNRKQHVRFDFHIKMHYLKIQQKVSCLTKLSQKFLVNRDVI